MKIRDLATAVLVAALSALLLAGPWSDRLDGISVDTLHWLRALRQQAGIMPPPPRPAVPLTVIAIDEATYDTQPFNETPRMMWTPEIAYVLNALGESDVAVVGIDMIFPISIEKYLPGFDRDFLLALRALAKDHRIVLAKVQHSTAPIAPHAGQSYAVGHGLNIRVVNLKEDPDGIIRRMPLTFSLTGPDGAVRREPSFAVEIAKRFSNSKHSLSPTGALKFEGREIPGTKDNALNLNFDTGPGALEVHSLADIYACAKAERGDFLRRHFAGKLVLFGLALDVEDRKLTSARLATKNLLRAGAPRCSAGPAAARAVGVADLASDRDSLPGVFLHAAAIANILRQDGLRLPGRGGKAGILFALAFVATLYGLLLGPLTGGALLGL
ncbi:MAG: CHASE2 domain-containing protein, partial [Alphaproteobacteria bacterium]|nr:CHASE2 domain-containing protein [Alphaproteobacteria bacterium]